MAAASGGLLVARLGTGEFFLEDGAAGTTLQRATLQLEANPPGVYPVLREDWAFRVWGEGVHDVLAQVCNVNFAQLDLESKPLIMTLMIGVAVLVVPEKAAGGRRYRIWCDPTFGPYLGESLGVVVLECGGRYTGVSA
jgi:sarcosine oxidase subunit gamma